MTGYGKYTYEIYDIDGDNEKLVSDGFSTLKEAKEYALKI